MPVSYVPFIIGKNGIIGPFFTFSIARFQRVYRSISIWQLRSEELWVVLIVFKTESPLL